MATNFPTSLDALTNPSGTDSMSSPSHSGQHADANDAIEALQAKVGADSSAVTTSHDYKISALETDVSTAQTDITNLETDVTNINELQRNTQTASYTLVLSDAGKLVEMNVSSANNLTVPPNSSVAFPTGTQILVVQLGTGTTTIVAGSGVSLRSKDSNLVINGRYVGVTLVKRNTDDWWVLGDLTS
jgi:hypothetical protein